MPEERFDQVELRLDGIGLRLDGIELRLDRIEDRLDQVDERFDQVDRRFDQLTADVAGLKGENEDLRRHMGVLHEDVIDRIRGIREDDSLRQEMRAGFAMLSKRFGDHAIPGEAADRSFAVTLADHEKRITTLERTSS